MDATVTVPDGLATAAPRSRLGLRTRVAALCALLGLVVSSCLALVAVHFSDSYVHRLINEMLRVEGDYLREHYAAGGLVPGPRGKHFRVYSSAASGAGAPPADLAALPPGIHEVENPHGEVHVAINEVDGGQRLYVVLDIGLESVRERRLARDLAALVLFGSGLSCWLGWFWAGRAIEPVRRLALKLEALEPPAGDMAALAPEFANDEVGALAQAFDRYQSRLADYVNRERAFTADASHELRTPLAVIRGAIEVLLDHGNLDAAAALRLKRIQRGADELRDLLDALLVLARGDARSGGADDATDLDVLLDGLLRDRADSLRERKLRIERSGGGAVVAAPSRVLAVVIGNLLRTATQFADGGLLRIDASAEQIAIDCAREAGARLAGPDASRPADAAERSLGLGMIRRVCERRGWSLAEHVGESRHAFVLRFRA